MAKFLVKDEATCMMCCVKDARNGACMCVCVCVCVCVCAKGDSGDAHEK